MAAFTHPLEEHTKKFPDLHDLLSYQWHLRRMEQEIAEWNEFLTSRLH